MDTPTQVAKIMWFDGRVGMVKTGDGRQYFLHYMSLAPEARDADLQGRECLISLDVKPYVTKVNQLTLLAARYR